MSFTLLGILQSQAAAGGLASDAQLLATTTATSNVSSMSLTGLNAYEDDFQHLQFIFSGKAVSAGYYLGVRPNNISTSGAYFDHNLYGTGSSTGAQVSSSLNTLRGILNFSNSYECSMEFWLPHFTSLNYLRKSGFTTGASHGGAVSMGGGNWSSAGTINSLTVWAGGNIASGSTLAVIGWK